MDSGASASIIHDSFVHMNTLKTRNTSANKWFTMAGSFSTSSEAEVEIKLPESYFMPHIFTPFHISSQKSDSDVIFGQDLLWELGINLEFQDIFVGWKQTKIPM